MRKVALDLGRKKTTYCEVEAGQVVRRTTVGSVESLAPLLGEGQPEAVVAIEACREAWYVHDLLTSWGNTVVMVDTTRSRRVGVGQHGRKTDRLDAEALARALERGGIPKAHVLSAARRELRRCLGARRALVESRANLVTTVRGMAREQGESLPDCETEAFVKRVRAKKLKASALRLIEPLLNVIEQIDQQLGMVEAELGRWCEDEPLIAHLATAPGVGAIVAAAFVSVIDEAGRFESAHHVESYIGLVPNERSSGGDKRRLGSITKHGNPYLRSMLVQAAWAIFRQAPDDDPLKLWGKEVATRRGKRIAIVAVARRLVGVLWAMWRDGTAYDPRHLAQQGSKGLRGAVRNLERNIEALTAAKKKNSFKRLAKQRTSATASVA